jgi:metal-responsive CopG/Arc/MetJ family transcriptional regulator
MATDVTSIRLPLKDAIMLDHFVESGEFKSRSEFIRFAVKSLTNYRKRSKRSGKSCGKTMLNIYLDTNVYVIGVLQSKTNGARILNVLKNF